MVKWWPININIFRIDKSHLSREIRKKLVGWHQNERKKKQITKNQLRGWIGQAWITIICFFHSFIQEVKSIIYNVRFIGFLFISLFFFCLPSPSPSSRNKTKNRIKKISFDSFHFIYCKWWIYFHLTFEPNRTYELEYSYWLNTEYYLPQNTLYDCRMDEKKSKKKKSGIKLSLDIFIHIHTRPMK